MNIENRCTGRTMRMILTSIVAASEAKRGQAVYVVVYNLRYCAHVRNRIRGILSTYLRTLEGVDRPYSDRNSEERVFSLPWGVDLCVISASSLSVRDLRDPRRDVHKAYLDNTVTDLMEHSGTTKFKTDLMECDVGDGGLLLL